MKKTDSTKNTIINSTIKLLRLNGTVTVKEISEDAKVNIASINYHFNDKYTLLTVVTRRIFGELKIQIDNLLNQTVITEANVRQSTAECIDVFYDFSIQNKNFIKFIFLPSNIELQDFTKKFIFQTFSLESDITNKVIKRLENFGTSKTADDLKVKYMLMFSSLCFPIYFQLDLSSISSRKPFPLYEPEIRQKYAEQLANIILS